MGTKFILGQEDGTVAGGNARGEAAVDLQMSRTAATQVAGRDYSVIAGGQNNLVGGVASAKWSGILAGRGNSVLGNFDGIISGDANTTNLSGSYNVIGGGLSNAVSGSAAYSGVFSGASNIASANYSVVSGGLSNTASSTWCTVSGGQSNTASTSTYATVVGGFSNTSSGQYSVSGGQSNTASGESAVALGRNNIASSTRGVSIGDNNNNSTSRGVAIGHDNTVTQAGGQFYAVAIGVSNSISSASGSRNYVFGESCSISSNGLRNTAIGFGSSISGLANNAMAINSATATATYSLGKGLHGVAYYYNGETRGGGIAFGGNIGTAQTTDLIAARLVTLTTAGTTVLSLDGTGVTELIIPNGTNRMWKVKVEYVGTITTITGTATGLTVGDSVYGEENFGFKRLASTSTMGPIMNETQSSDNAIMDTCSLAVTAGASQEMALTFTGPTFAGGGSVTMRVVAKVALVEVAF